MRTREEIKRVLAFFDRIRDNTDPLCPERVKIEAAKHGAAFRWVLNEVPPVGSMDRDYFDSFEEMVRQPLNSRG